MTKLFFVVGGKCADGRTQKYKKPSEENHLVHYKLMVSVLKPYGRASEPAGRPGPGGGVRTSMIHKSNHDAPLHWLYMGLVRFMS